MNVELLVHPQADSDGKRAEYEAERAESEAKRVEYEAKRAEYEAKRAEYEAKRAEYEAKRAEYEAKADARQARMERSLRRWAALGVKEARRERARRRELDARLSAAHQATEESIMHLAVAQLVTEEKLAAFIASLGTGRNGGSNS